MAASADSQQLLKASEYVSLRLDSCGITLTSDEAYYMTAWDILSRLRVRSSPQLDISHEFTFCTAINLVNIFLYRGVGGAVQSSGYFFLSPSLGLPL